MKCEKLLMAFA